MREVLEGWKVVVVGFRTLVYMFACLLSFFWPVLVFGVAMTWGDMDLMQRRIAVTVLLFTFIGFLYGLGSVTQRYEADY